MNTLQITAQQVCVAVCSFRSGSAGGLDGLTPQHLKDLISSGAREAGESLLKELTALINFMLSGNVNNAVIDILYGSNLCACYVGKKDGGIHPMAVGSTYRRMVVSQPKGDNPASIHFWAIFKSAGQQT